MMAALAGIGNENSYAAVARRLRFPRLAILTRKSTERHIFELKTPHFAAKSAQARNSQRNQFTSMSCDIFS
jgi:hypothetical protein